MIDLTPIKARIEAARQKYGGMIDYVHTQPVLSIAEAQSMVDEIERLQAQLQYLNVEAWEP